MFKVITLIALPTVSALTLVACHFAMWVAKFF